MPSVHCYARLAYGESRESTSFQALLAKLWRGPVAEAVRGGLAPGELFVDAADAASLPFSRRPAAQALSMALQPGDVVILAASWSAFRDTRDLAKVLRTWNRSTQLWIADWDACRLIESLSPDRLLTTVVQDERRRRAERTRRSHAIRHDKGLAPNQHAGIGYRWISRPGRRLRVPDEEERTVMARIARLKRGGASFPEIARRLEKEGIRTRQGCHWSLSRIRHAYRAELRRPEEPAPAAIPQKRCLACGQIKPRTETHFHRHRGCRDGYRAQCKSCRAKKREHRQTVAHRRQATNDALAIARFLRQ